ncbi:type III polyketide synthase [Alkalibacillus silvisoli]|uniref:Type III polyketide synthase BpsA n=1 Tax=Alkalibacillus silvisoli TaxID=392823 RepID=A0ABN0ZU92_9BACI
MSNYINIYVKGQFNKKKDETSMALIASVGTAVPKYQFEQSFAKDIISQIVPSNSLKKYLSVFDEAAIDHRYFVTDETWFQQAHHGLKERNDLWLNEGIKLAKEAIKNCLGEVYDVSNVDAIVSVTSTGILTPSMEVHLLNELNFKTDIKRMPLFGLGCAGGAIGLSRAFDYIKAHPDESVLLVTCELASVAFHHQNLKPKDIVGAAIFSDGAAATLLLGENHPKANRSNQSQFFIKSSDSKVKPKSMDVMGWDVHDDGFYVIFDVSIPKLIEPFWKSHVDQFLNKHKMKAEEIKHIIAHPGGRKIIEEMERVLLTPNLLSHSKKVLSQYGNMSSPTVLFVLNELMKQADLEQGYALLSALGPGFASEVVLMEVV